MLFNISLFFVTAEPFNESKLEYVKQKEVEQLCLRCFEVRICPNCLAGDLWSPGLWRAQLEIRHMISEPPLLPTACVVLGKLYA